MAADSIDDVGAFDALFFTNTHSIDDPLLKIARALIWFLIAAAIVALLVYSPWAIPLVTEVLAPALAASMGMASSALAVKVAVTAVVAACVFACEGILLGVVKGMTNWRRQRAERAERAERAKYAVNKTPSVIEVLRLELLTVQTKCGAPAVPKSTKRKLAALQAKKDYHFNDWLGLRVLSAESQEALINSSSASVTAEVSPLSAPLHLLREHLEAEMLNDKILGASVGSGQFLLGESTASVQCQESYFKCLEDVLFPKSGNAVSAQGQGSSWGNLRANESGFRAKGLQNLWQGDDAVEGLTPITFMTELLPFVMVLEKAADTWFQREDRTSALDTEREKWQQSVFAAKAFLRQIKSNAIADQITEGFKYFHGLRKSILPQAELRVFPTMPEAWQNLVRKEAQQAAEEAAAQAQAQVARESEDAFMKWSEPLWKGERAIQGLTDETFLTLLTFMRDLGYESEADIDFQSEDSTAALEEYRKVIFAAKVLSNQLQLKYDRGETNLSDDVVFDGCRYFHALHACDSTQAGFPVMPEALQNLVRKEAPQAAEEAAAQAPDANIDRAISGGVSTLTSNIAEITALLTAAQAVLDNTISKEVQQLEANVERVTEALVAVSKPAAQCHPITPQTRGFEDSFIDDDAPVLGSLADVESAMKAALSVDGGLRDCRQAAFTALAKLFSSDQYRLNDLNGKPLPGDCEVLQDLYLDISALYKRVGMQAAQDQNTSWVASAVGLFGSSADSREAIENSSGDLLSRVEADIAAFREQSHLGSSWFGEGDGNFEGPPEYNPDGL